MILDKEVFLDVAELYDDIGHSVFENEAGLTKAIERYDGVVLSSIDGYISCSFGDNIKGRFTKNSDGYFELITLEVVVDKEVLMIM